MGLAALEADYLFLGSLIKERLEELLPDLPCEVVETPEQVLSEDLRPAVLKVYWAGDVPQAGDAGRVGSGKSQMLRQRWLVTLGLNNPSPLPDARKGVAGPLLSRIHRALSGWEPAGTAGRSMQRATASLAPTFTRTQGIFPLGFEITLAI